MLTPYVTDIEDSDSVEYCVLCVSCRVNSNEEDEFTHTCQGWFLNGSFCLCV